jgi:S-formylglutathione hydrolase FrmB
MIGRYAALILTLASVVSCGGQLRQVSIPSPAMDKSFKTTIATPSGYATEKKRYPVIYFLHGYSQNHRVWAKIAPLARYADRYDIICVCPEGDYDSWYIDSPVRTDSRFGFYIGKELPAWIDSVYRTVASRNGRALLGSSMGGHGAVSIAAAYPKRFCGAVSISGIMDLTEFPGEWGIADVLGAYAANQDIWRMYSALSLADSLAAADLALAFDVGTEDFALAGNRRMHQRLQQLQIPHDYCERPGAHTPRYVRNAVEYQVMFLVRAMGQNR